MSENILEQIKELFNSKKYYKIASLLLEPANGEPFSFKIPTVYSLSGYLNSVQSKYNDKYQAYLQADTKIEDTDELLNVWEGLTIVYNALLQRSIKNNGLIFKHDGVNEATSMDEQRKCRNQLIQVQCIISSLTLIQECASNLNDKYMDALEKRIKEKRNKLNSLNPSLMLMIDHLCLYCTIEDKPIEFPIKMATLKYFLKHAENIEILGMIAFYQSRETFYAFQDKDILLTKESFPMLRKPLLQMADAFWSIDSSSAHLSGGDTNEMVVIKSSMADFISMCIDRMTNVPFYTEFDRLILRYSDLISDNTLFNAFVSRIMSRMLTEEDIDVMVEAYAKRKISVSPLLIQCRSNNSKIYSSCLKSILKLSSK